MSERAGRELSRRLTGISQRHVSSSAVQRVVFTIEPFREGEPGLHVTAPVAAIRAMDVDVEVGPFGSSCTVDDAAASDVVGVIVRTAVEHGATHVNVNVIAESSS